MTEDRADLLGPGNRLWNKLEVTDAKFTKDFDRGQFKGRAVDAIYNIKRVSELLGPVGFAWGWEVKSERLDTYGAGEDEQTIHSCVVRVWFRQPDGSKEHVEHIGHTKAAYWTRPRRPGDKPRYVVDDECGKKSVTDALSKVMVSLGASADIWLGRFDGNKYVAPADDEGERPPAKPRQAQQRQAPASEEDGTKAEAPPPAADRGEPTYVLDGVRLRAEAYVDACKAVVEKRAPVDAAKVWNASKAERARLHRDRPDLNDALLTLKRRLAERTTNGIAAGHA